MKHSYLILLVFLTQVVCAQGWRARVSLNFGYGSTPLASVDNATVSFSETTVFGSSPSSNLTLDLTGPGAPSGPLYIFAAGRSVYNPDEISYVSLTLEGPFDATCETYYLDMYGTSNEYISGTFNVYPRLEISHYTEECNRVTLTTDVCSPGYKWEVSDYFSGPWKVVTNRIGSGISLTGEDLSSLGLRKYGQKFMRVTGQAGTTSPVVPVYLFAPGPAASFEVTPPKCYGSADGAIRMIISSAYPEVINDFVAGVYRQSDGLLLKQVTLDNSNEVSINGLSAGNYRVKISNNTQKEMYGGCESIFEMAPLINPEKVSLASMEVSDHNGFAVSCHGGVNGTIKVTPIGGTGTFTNYDWAPKVSSTNAAANLSAGTYSIKAMDSNGCWSDVYTRVLRAPEELKIELVSSGGKKDYDVSCHNMTDGKITTLVSGGVPAYSFRWSNGAAGSALENLPAGQYGVDVTDRNGCAATASLTLIAPEELAFEVRTISGIICPNDESGAIEVRNVHNAIGQIFYSWSSGESTETIFSKGSGVYSVTVSDEQGCMRKQSITLEEPGSWTVAAVVASDYNGSPISCNGDQTGRISTVVKNSNNELATAEYYSWYDNAHELVAEGISRSAIDHVSAGIYTVKIAYNGTCETENSIEIKEPPPLQAQILSLSDYNGSPVTCTGASDASLEVIASGGTGDHFFQWQSGQTGSVVTDLPAGHYSVTVRDENACEAIAERIIAAPDPVEVFVSVLSDYNGEAISCFGASDARLKASARGGVSLFTYEWSTGDRTSELGGIPAGQYTVLVKDANGCAAESDTTVNDPAPVTIQISESSDYNGYGVSCNGADDGYVGVVASGGTGQHSYRWSETAHSAPAYVQLRAGKYTATGTDQNGCAASVETIIAEPDLLNLEVTDAVDISCHEGMDGEITLNASGGSGGYEYSSTGQAWQQDPLLKSLNAGDHMLYVRDRNGCHQTARYILQQPSAITIEFKDLTPALCGDPVGSVSTAVAGGSGSYQYHWTDARGTAVSENAKLTGLHPGIYILKVLDARTCEAHASVGITSTDGPRVRMASSIRPTCFDAHDGSAAIEVLSGTGPFSYLWKTGQETAEVAGLRAGSHWVEVTDANSCTVAQTFTLAAPDPLEIKVIEKIDPTCYGDCNGMITVTASGGNGNYVYAWDNFAGAEARDLCAGKYALAVTDESGCKSETVLELNQPDPLISRSVLLRNPTCPGACDGALSVQSTGGTGEIHYAWSNGESGPAIDSLCAETYAVTIRDSQDCVTAGTYVVSNPVATTLDLGGSAVICSGQTYTLDAGPLWAKHAWASSEGFKSTDRQITVSQGGTYWLDAFSFEGCLIQDTFHLETVRDLLKANFLLASEAQIMDTIVAVDISWPVPENSIWKLPEQMSRLSGTQDVVYGRFNQTGEFPVTLVATLGDCRDEMTKRIMIHDDPADSTGGRLGYENFVQEFNLYPNPNNGLFDVAVKFIESSPIVLSVWNTLTAKKLWEVKDQGGKEYTKNVDLRPLSAGSYTLRMDYLRGTRYLRFIVR